MIKDIGNYRTQLMGFAIIWVLLFHSGLNIPVIKTFFNIGYGGVDIFFMLSGYGLYYSFVKNRSLVSFYKKRILRIIPTYAIIVLLISLVLKEFSWTTYLIDISTLGFWFGNIFFEWYIPSLVAFYFLFPLLFKAVEQNIKVFSVGLILVTITLILVRAHTNTNEMHILFITRIPVFCIGIILGKYAYEKKNIGSEKIKWLYLLSLIGIISLFGFIYLYPNSLLWKWGLLWLPFALITPGLCLLLIYVFKMLSPHILKILTFFGTLSLEIYLIHVKLFENAEHYATNFKIPRLIVLVIILAITIFISMILSKIVGRLLKRIEGINLHSN